MVFKNSFENTYFNWYWCNYWTIVFKKFSVNKHFDNNYRKLDYSIQLQMG